MKATSRCGPLLVLATLGVFLMTGAAAEGGSIWAKAKHRITALHTDDAARKMGDMLTIVIDERSVIDNQTGRQMSKKSTRDASVSGNVDLLRAIDRATGKLLSVPDMSLNVDAETKFDGSADYQTDRKMSDQITVTVTDVLPNGNLVVVGSREREVAGDKQIMQVSGVVRPSDITYANTVRSDKVAEFKIVLKTVGHENCFTKPGWLDRLLNIINPF